MGQLLSALNIPTSTPTPTTPAIQHMSKGEQECARVLEELYPHHTFTKVRPDFLRNPESGKNLELDLYNAQLKIAVEYNGAQHYQYTPKFHKSPTDLVKQQRRDRLKTRLCREQGIHLIVVPYTERNIRRYLQTQLQEHVCMADTNTSHTPNTTSNTTARTSNATVLTPNTTPRTPKATARTSKTTVRAPAKAHSVPEASLADTLQNNLDDVQAQIQQAQRRAQDIQRQLRQIQHLAQPNSCTLV